LQLLEAAPGHKLSRKGLDAVVVEIEDYDASNVLRAIRGLARKRLVIFTDGHHKTDSTVCLPKKVRHFTDDEIFDLRRRMGATSE
jgi:hypothetical protein